MKFYLASLFSERILCETLAKTVEDQLGWECSASWVFGGEEGLTREQIAILDLEDVYRSDILIILSKPYGSKNKGGGRWVEFGYALALDKPCVVIGEKEVVFTDYPSVRVYKNLKEFLIASKDWAVL